MALFLILALTPLLIVSLVSYFSAKKILLDDTTNSLTSLCNEKTAFIDNWFHYRFVDLESQAKSQDNRKFLLELSKGYRNSDKDLAAFVKSNKWKLLADN